jgi:TrmH family RNA methyltransferase
MTGRTEEITSPANPRIKAIKALHLKKNRDADGVFLAEGMKLVIDALDGGWSVSTLLHAKSAGHKPVVAALAERALASGADVLVVPEKLLTTITRKDNPQSVVAVISQRIRPLAELTVTDASVHLALDRVRDPGNLGTIIRTADAAGVASVILIGDSVDPFATETVRATMGSIFAVPLYHASEAEFIAWAKTQDALVAGTHLAGSVDYRAPAWGQRSTVLVMGNESQGMTAPLAEACTVLVRIPQAGQADSLNLSVATGIVLYEVMRAHFPMPDGAGQ